MKTHNRPTRTTRRGQEGLTLIEVVAATAVLLGAVLSLATVASSTHRLRRAVFEKELVLSAVEQEIAEIEATDFDQLVTDHDGRSFSLGGVDGREGTLAAWPDDADDQPGQVAVTVLRSMDGQPTLLQATVTVSWFGVSGRQTLSRTVRVSRLGSS